MDLQKLCVITTLWLNIQNSFNHHKDLLPPGSIFTGLLGNLESTISVFPINNTPFIWILLQHTIVAVDERIHPTFLSLRPLYPPPSHPYLSLTLFSLPPSSPFQHSLPPTSSPSHPPLPPTLLSLPPSSPSHPPLPPTLLSLPPSSHSPLLSLPTFPTLPSYHLPPSFLPPSTLTFPTHPLTFPPYYSHWDFLIIIPLLIKETG